MRILIAVHKLTGGGAEKVAACWADILAGKGHDVTVLTDADTPFIYPVSGTVKIENRNYVRIKSGQDSILRKVYAVMTNGPKAFMQYMNLFRKYRPEAVISILHLNPYALWLAKILNGGNVALVASDHNPYERPAGMKMGWRKWRNKFIDNRLFDRVTVLSPKDKEILAANGIRKVDVIPNPVFMDIPAAEVVKMPRSKTVLTVGRIERTGVKGFDILASQWPKIRKLHPDWKLRMVGDGLEDLKARLIDMAGGADNGVEILPFDTDVAKYYLDAEIFVSASRYEGWGLALTEAMACGCAVVATDFRGRQRAIVRDGYDGLLVAPEDGDELRNNILRLIENSGERRMLQRNAPSVTERFSTETVGSQLEVVIGDCVGKHRKKGGDGK